MLLENRNQRILKSESSEKIFHFELQIMTSPLISYDVGQLSV